MASQEVLNFLENHIRPFSVNEIQQGVKGDFGKSAIQKALDLLIEKGHVKEKTYGKQKVSTFCSTAIFLLFLDWIFLLVPFLN